MKKLLIIITATLIAILLILIPNSIAFNWREFPIIDYDQQELFRMHYWKKDNIVWKIYYNTKGYAYSAIGWVPVEGPNGKLTVVGQPLKWYWYDLNGDSVPYVDGNIEKGLDVEELLYDEAGDGLNGNEITPDLPLSMYNRGKLV